MLDSTLFRKTVDRRRRLYEGVISILVDWLHPLGDRYGLKDGPDLSVKVKARPALPFV